MKGFGTPVLLIQTLIVLGNFRYNMKGYHGERRGEREDMQDAHVMLDDFTPQFKSLPNSM